jgi:hypothetical protein
MHSFDMQNFVLGMQNIFLMHAKLIFRHANFIFGLCFFIVSACKIFFRHAKQFFRHAIYFFRMEFNFIYSMKNRPHRNTGVRFLPESFRRPCKDRQAVAEPVLIINCFLGSNIETQKYDYFWKRKYYYKDSEQYKFYLPFQIEL